MPFKRTFGEIEDDTEGHGFMKKKLGETEDDTEGHAEKKKHDETDEDVQGQIYIRRRPDVDNVEG